MEPLSTRETMKFIYDYYLPATFVEDISLHSVPGTSLRGTYYNGGMRDYEFIGRINAQSSEDVDNVLKTIRKDTGKKRIPIKFFSSSRFGGDYGDPFAKEAEGYFANNDEVEVSSLVWMKQDIEGRDGSKNFNFDNARLEQAQDRFNIRPATKYDTKALAQIYNSTINDTVEYHDANMGEDELSPVMKRILTAGNPNLEIRVMLAYSNLPDSYGELAGFYISGTDGKAAYLNDIGVMSKFRKQSLAGLLIKDLIKHVKQLGSDFIALDTVSPANIAFYNATGFRQFGETYCIEDKEI